MKIILYNSSAEKNRVDKGGHFSQIVELTGTLRSGTSIVNPAIVLELHEDKLAKLTDSEKPTMLGKLSPFLPVR